MSDAATATYVLIGVIVVALILAYFFIQHITQDLSKKFQAALDSQVTSIETAVSNQVTRIETAVNNQATRFETALNGQSDTFAEELQQLRAV